ncbi:hypothetical protein J437_LFUL010193 [Ladona fulva]|uniref:Peroxidase n=1 Tax=Ladona fulva TaxID=123851 RepID=A0A8K0K8E6_LADFU|nr:hypothetical protein J437_LFUL010193 [Ladona fulva]
MNKDEDGLPGMLLMRSGRHLLNTQPGENYPKVPRSVVNAAVAYANDVVGRSARLEMNLENAKVNVGVGSAEHGQLIASYPRREALRRHGNGLVAAKASLHLMHSVCNKIGLSEDKCVEYISEIDLSGTALEKHCQEKASSYQSCQLKSPYRTADGSCNNLKNPSLGKTYTGYRRLLFPKYGDGIQQIRRSVIGKPLPSARLLSTSLSPDVDMPDQVTTLSLMQWTQFVEHDLSHTPSAMKLATGGSIMCCRDNGFPLSPRFLHPSCAPIDIPEDDPFYSQHSQLCMNYVRSITTIRPGCTLGPSEQLNQASHFLDASMIYGPDAETQRYLRSFTDGKLKSAEQKVETEIGERGVEFFPRDDTPFDFCQLKSTDGHECYYGGDSRANEHPHLTVLHTLWLREHNRIADKLAELNPHWDDERLFQEARRIVIAQLQHITYNEWLPKIIGNEYYNKLFPESDSIGSIFDKDLDPSTSNEFASAAIRFAHSMMESNIRLYEEGRDINNTILLRNHYNHPVIVEEPGNFDSLVRGMATQNSQQMDLLFSSDVTSLLWRDRKPFGLDIISLDIQRGRDHGLQPYNKYREFCGLPLAKDFDDLLDVMPKLVVDELRRLYPHVDDIDLYVGGMSESPRVEAGNLRGGKGLKSGQSLVGPTFRCIIGEQMLRTRRGDRLFFDIVNEDGSTGLSPDQILEIKRSSLARIFCDNANDVAMMQRDVFQKPSNENPMSPCSDSFIPSLDLSYWQE